MVTKKAKIVRCQAKGCKASFKYESDGSAKAEQKMFDWEHEHAAENDGHVVFQLDWA